MKGRHTITQNELDEWLRMPQWQKFAGSYGDVSDKTMEVDGTGPGGPVFMVDNPYRNHYCTEVGGKTSKRFEESGCWDLARTINQGRDAVYALNDRGFKMLRDWLANRALTSGQGNG